MEEASIQARSKHLGFRSPFEFNLSSIQSSTQSSTQSSFANALCSRTGCSGRGSNPHTLRRQNLNLVCLPFHHPSETCEMRFARRTAEASA